MTAPQPGANQNQPASPHEAGDGDLLSAAARGDGTAFRLLLDRYMTKVFANCYRVLGESSEAEDATQESFSRLWKVLSTNASAQAPDRDAGGWLMRTSRNLCIDKLRRRKRWVSGDGIMDGHADEKPNAEAMHQSQDVSIRVQKALAGLPDRQRAALALVHFEGVSQGEAAETMGISVDALESLLARGRRSLRSQLLDEKQDLLS
ncbi:MAG: sigma-70 family RNA polymerase sigma factor [Alphaproteobacteria bacterium]|nr:sigma-70 family RNA polymerase sigma factor [Alphaproteobacteria bacterium]